MLTSGKTLWVLGLHWRAAYGQPHGDFFFWWKYESGNVGTRIALKIVSGNLLYTGIPRSIRWRITWILVFTLSCLSLITWVLGLSDIRMQLVPWVLTGPRDSLHLDY